MPEPIKDLAVCFVSQEYPPETGWGGIGSYVFEMATALRKMGCTVAVLSRATGQECHRVEDGIHVYRVRIASPLSRIRFLWRYQQYFGGGRRTIAQKLAEIVETHRIDLIEAPEARAEILWYQFFCSRRPSIVIKMHSSRWLIDRLCNKPVRLWNRLEHRYEWLSIRRADLVTSCSHALLTECADYLPKRDYRVIPNPISVPQSIAPISEYPEVVYTGRLEWRKGVQILREVIPQVLEGTPAARFVLLGADLAGPGGLKMSEYILGGLDEKLRGQVQFTGAVPREEVLARLRSRPVCVFPSLWENFPYACLEAMAQGCAVVGSRNGGMAEMIEDGVSGILVDPNDASSIAGAVQGLLSSPDSRRWIGEKAHHRVKENFSAERVAGKTVAIYREAMGINRLRHDDCDYRLHR